MRNTSNAHRFYLGFSVLLLIGLAAAVWFSRDFVITIFKTSVPLNSAIIAVIWGSICLAMWYIISAYRDISVFDRFTQWCKTPEDEGFDIDRVESGFLGVVLRPIIGSIRHNGSRGLTSASEVRSMMDSVEQNISSRANLVSFLGGFLVLLGLLGTFLGLTITLDSMGTILSTLAGGLRQDATDSILTVMVELITRLNEPLAGMGTAFSTSLFGLAGSGAVGILAVLMSRLHDHLKWELESWLSEQVRISSESARKDGQDFPLDGDLPEQLLAIDQQLAALRSETGAALSTANTYLLEMFILQKQATEILRTNMDLTAEIQKGILLGNDLTGRLARDSQLLVSTLKETTDHE